MSCSQHLRFASSAAATAPPRTANGAEEVPRVMVKFGTGVNNVTFVSHPGVMALSKLLEMPKMIKHHAVFSQENVNAIREFDNDLADKCQVALDNNLPINMMDLEYINHPDYLQRQLAYQKVVQKARAEVHAIPKGGPYPARLRAVEEAGSLGLAPPEPDLTWNPANEVGPEVFEVQPGYRQEVELRGIVKTFLRSQAGGGGGGGVNKKITTAAKMIHKNAKAIPDKPPSSTTTSTATTTTTTTQTAPQTPQAQRKDKP